MYFLVICTFRILAPTLWDYFYIEFQDYMLRKL